MPAAAVSGFRGRRGASGPLTLSEPSCRVGESVHAVLSGLSRPPQEVGLEPYFKN